MGRDGRDGGRGGLKVQRDGRKIRIDGLAHEKGKQRIGRVGDFDERRNRRGSLGFGGGRRFRERERSENQENQNDDGDKSPMRADCFQSLEERGWRGGHVELLRIDGDIHLSDTGLSGDVDEADDIAVGDVVGGVDCQGIPFVLAERRRQFVREACAFEVVQQAITDIVEKDERGAGRERANQDGGRGRRRDRALGERGGREGE